MDKMSDVVMKTSARSERDQERLLIGRVHAGEEAAVRELVDRHKDRLFAFIWRMTRHEQDAEDICQETFLKAFAAIDSFSPQYRFSTWLFTIGYRISLNRMRRKPVRTVDVDLSAISSAVEDVKREELFESPDAVELKDCVWQAVDQLSPPQRATVLLFYRHEKGCQEIAKVLEIPVATVKSHLHRARHRLREILGSLGDRRWQDVCNFVKRTG